MATSTKPVIVDQEKRQAPAIQGQVARSAQVEQPIEDETAHFDKEGLLVRAGGDWEVVNLIMETLLSDLSDRIRELRKAVEDANPEEIRLHAHSLKGTAGIAGAVALQELLRKIEARVPEGRQGEKKVLMAWIDKEIEQLAPILSRYLEA